MFPEMQVNFQYYILPMISVLHIIIIILNILNAQLPDVRRP